MRYRLAPALPVLSLPLSLALSLNACAVGPDYAHPAPPASRALESGAFLRAGETDKAEPAARWWDGLGDAQLSALIDQGLLDAPAIAAAQARVRQARAGLSAARANLLPSAGPSALYAYADLPANALGSASSDIDFYSLGFDAQWEADIWGGKRRDAQAALADAGAADAALADVQVGLSAEIARTYAALRARQASEALLAQRYEVDQQTAEFAAQRVKAGTLPRQALEAAQLEKRQTESERAIMAAELATLRDALAILTGSAPGALDTLAEGPVPMPPAQVAVGDPAGMLARRPDIRAAERRLAAASARIGVEQARRFPSVSLMGLVGIGGTSADDVFDTSQLSTILLPRLSWNFLDFGRTAAAVRGAKAGRDAALADYRTGVLAALQDAEASLARFGAARTVYLSSAQSARHVREIARLQNLRAEAGTASQVEALEARRQAIDAQLAVVNNQASLTIAYVSLAKALGLGWEPAAAGPANRQGSKPDG